MKSRTLDFTLPDEFHDHKVISNYGLAEVGHPRVLHEIRTIVTIDGKALEGSGQTRHVLTAGLNNRRTMKPSDGCWRIWTAINSKAQ